MLKGISFSISLLREVTHLCELLGHVSHEFCPSFRSHEISFVSSFVFSLAAKCLILSGICLAGSIAQAQSTSFVVTTIADTVSAADNLTSLREALAYAATLSGPQSITFGNGSAISGGTNFTDATADTITLNGTELDVASDLTIQGPGMNLLQVDAASGSRVFSSVAEQPFLTTSAS